MVQAQAVANNLPKKSVWKWIQATKNLVDSGTSDAGHMGQRPSSLQTSSVAMVVPV